MEERINILVDEIPRVARDNRLTSIQSGTTSEVEDIVHLEFW